MIAQKESPRPTRGRQAAAEVVAGMTPAELAELYLVALEVLAQVSPRARAFPTSTQHYIDRRTLRRLAKATKQRW